MKPTRTFLAALITLAIAGSASAADTRSWTSSDASPSAQTQAAQPGPASAPQSPTSTDEARAAAEARTSASEARAMTDRAMADGCACHHGS